MTTPFNEEGTDETTGETGIGDSGNDPASGGGDGSTGRSGFGIDSGGDVEVEPVGDDNAVDSGGDVETHPSDFSAAKRSGGDVEFGRSGGDVERSGGDVESPRPADPEDGGIVGNSGDGS